MDVKRILSSVVYQLYTNALLACLLLGVSAYMLTATFAPSSLVAVGGGLVGFGIGAVLSRLYQNKKPRAISLIHQRVGDTEYSLSLLDKEELTIADQLQLHRLSEKLQGVPAPTIVFSKLGIYGLALLFSIGFHFAYPYLKSAPTPTRQRMVTAGIPDEAAEQTTAPVFRSAALRIQPPAYTALPATRTTDLNATAVAGSLLQWQVQFSHSRKLSVRLVNSRGEELAFVAPRAAGSATGLFEYRDQLVSSGLYAIKAYWSAPSGRDSLVYQSDFYRLEARPDLAPKIEPDSKELYRFHYLKDPKMITVSARMSDDFKVSQAYMIATLARGSGENVKFREVRIPLDRANFKDARLSKSINLKAFNFAPGDELYYYWAAVDNRQPEPNFAKSDTYFIVYKDTTKLDEADLATMAMNAMPEYFRSQRQIIIDTEKLLAKRKKIKEQDFKSTSNEIGFDQKALRLRYGQYLGEEFEASIGGDAVPEGEGNLLDGYVHKHDSEDADHGAPGEHHEQEHEHEHGHSHGESHAGEEKDPLAALMESYVHSHDDGEANTYFEQSTRSLLKMAVEQMWQSELHLRLFEPEKALPFEHKALEYLKSAQQKARTFVKKTSLDPPPIKEKEIRLTGELKAVNPAFRQERTYGQERVAKLVGVVLGFVDLPRLSGPQKQTVQQLSVALTDNGTSPAVRHWTVLRSLQKLANGQELSTTERQQLKTRLYGLAGASQQTSTSHASEKKLEQAFWRRLR